MDFSFDAEFDLLLIFKMKGRWWGGKSKFVRNVWLFCLFVAVLQFLYVALVRFVLDCTGKMSVNHFIFFVQIANFLKNTRFVKMQRPQLHRQKNKSADRKRYMHNCLHTCFLV